MSKVTFSARSAKGRVRNVSARPRLDQDEFRVAFARLRESDVTAGADAAWSWLEAGWKLIPAALDDRVTWSYDPVEPWSVAYTTDVRPLEVVVDGEVVLADGRATRVDGDEIRARAAEQAIRLATRMGDHP